MLNPSHPTFVAALALALGLGILTWAARAVTPAAPVRKAAAASQPPASAADSAAAVGAGAASSSALGAGASTSGALGPTTLLDPQLAVPPAASGIKLDIPLAWQLTKSRLAEKGATTMTESYRETWTIEQRPDGTVHLVSPRARVAAFLPPGEALKPGVTPSAVIVADTDLARLVGVPVEPLVVDGEELPRPSTPVTLKLVRSPKSGTDVTMAWSDEEHFAVHLDVDNATLF